MGGIKGCKLISGEVFAAWGLTLRLFCSEKKILEDPKDCLSKRRIANRVIGEGGEEVFLVEISEVPYTICRAGPDPQLSNLQTAAQAPPGPQKQDDQNRPARARATVPSSGSTHPADH